MNKQEFLQTLEDKLSGLPQEDRNRSIEFYSEMIDDRIDEGMSEEEAVMDIGSIDGIVQETIKDVPLTKIIKEKATPKRSLKTWEIVLLILGSPLWIPLLITAVVLMLTVFIVLYSMVLVLFAVVSAIFVFSVLEIVSVVTSIIASKIMVAVVHCGLSIAFAGLGLLMVVVSVKATVGIVKLSKSMILGIKKFFVGGDK